jgi:hypothetical protein
MNDSTVISVSLMHRLASIVILLGAYWILTDLAEYWLTYPATQETVSMRFLLPLTFFAPVIPVFVLMALMGFVWGHRAIILTPRGIKRNLVFTNRLVRWSQVELAQETGGQISLHFVESGGKQKVMTFMKVRFDKHLGTVLTYANKYAK